MDAWIIWLIAAAICLSLEVLTQAMWTLCFTVAALAAMAASLLGFGTTGQLVALVVGALAAYLLLIPFYRRWLVKHHNHADRTGMDALLGRRATVTEEIRPGELGRARIDGDNWQVRAPGVTAVIPRNAEVTVTGYDSIILDVAAE